MNILLVEDDADLARGLQKSLKNEGFSVNHVDCGQQALDSILTSEPDLVVLDLGLPDIDGLQVLKKIRANQQAIPILILTARDSINDKVIALDGGADDYLAKPFEMPELLARIRVLARRLSSSVSSHIVLGDVSLNAAAHQASVAGTELDLSRREYMLLKALMENIGRIQTKESLEGKLYGWGEEVSSNTIEVHISNLRKKIPNGFIKTIRGVGYTVNHTSR
jgi:DNA-binding response OmpR family regulator